MLHKNDYTCIVYFPDNTPKKWTYVHNLNGFSKFLDKEHGSWKYFNVYERRTGKYLKRFYRGNFISYFLPLITFLVWSTFFLTFNSNRFHSPANTFNNDFNNAVTIPTPKIQKGGVQ